MLRITGIISLLYLLIIAIVYLRQRSLLYFPTHDANHTSELKPWKVEGILQGYCREVTNPQTIWLMFHGNGGQAADRGHVLGKLSVHDSLYVMEYPGYGNRPGNPSLKTINKAASEAYRHLRTRFTNSPVCVLGESLGSGPACSLARESHPPDKIILLVPYDQLTSVASEHYPWLPVRLMLKDSWNNSSSLSSYTGPVEIYAALYDTVIPIKHAESLAKNIPKAKFITFSGGHQDWSQEGNVKIRR